MNQTRPFPIQNRPTQPRQNPSEGAGVRPTQPRQNPSEGADSAQINRNMETNEVVVVQGKLSVSNSNAEADMMDAKTTEVSYPAKKSDSEDEKKTVRKRKKHRKKRSKEENSQGEGGNTVISLVKAIVYIVFVLTVSIFSAIFIILVGNDVFAFVKNDEVREIVIPEDATLDDLAEILHENEIIAYPKIFKIYATLKKDKQEYMPGTYSISPMNNYEELLGAFKKKVVAGVQDIMIPEGFTTDEIIDLFVSRGIGTREGFIDVINNYDFDYWFVDELGDDWAANGRIYRLDGYLFPDTYQFYNGSSEVTVIKKLLQRFNQLFNKQRREHCAALGYTVDEIVTLASIIEKEAGSAAEFFYVSSVFHNRLNKPHLYPKLESDATIVYAIQHETGERPVLTGEDLQYDTPYNTYTINGLPPGPIANPSASAIHAALSPVETNYHFFVSSEGKTYFSETREEHDRKVAELRAQHQAAENANTQPDE